MKNIILFTFFILNAHSVYCQQSKEVRGSFVVNDNLYNYTYLLSSGDIATHSFKIYPANVNSGLTSTYVKQLLDTSRASLSKIKSISDFFNTEKRIDTVITNFSKIQSTFDDIQKTLIATNSLYKKFSPTINKVKLQQDTSINVIKKISDQLIKLDTTSFQSFTTTAKSFTSLLNDKTPTGDIILPNFFRSMKKNIIASKDTTYKKVFNNLRDSLIIINKILLNNRDYTLKTEGLLQTTFETIKNYIPNENEIKAIIFNDFSLNTFYTAFNKQLSPYENAYIRAIDKDSTEKEVYKGLVYHHYYRIQNKILLVDDEPLTAYLFVNTLDVPVHNYNDPSKVKLLKLADIQLEFAEGAIKNILISLNDTTLKGHIYTEVLFRNNIPIAVSGKFKPEHFIKHKIYCSKCWVGPKGDRSDGYVLLGDLLTYKIIYSLDNEDYSPAQSLIKLTPQETFAELKKEKRSKLFEVRAYTDLIGINEKNPNGLLQLEIRKRINVSTQPTQWLGGSFGLFSYFEPFIRYSKIENTNKYYVINSPLKTENKFNVNILQAQRYQNFSVGGELNIIKLSVPNIISDFYLNTGFYWQYTPVTFDTLATNVKLKPNTDYFNFLSYRIGSVWQLNPDGRLGFNVLTDIIISEIESNTFRKDDKSSTIFSLGMEAFFKPNETAKIFGRFKWNAQSNNISNNYYIFQIGYLFDVFNNKRF